MRVAISLALLLLRPEGTAQLVSQELPLPTIAPAPEFTLTSQDGAQVALADFRGKVVAVTFIYTLCTNTCPVLTPMMSFVQDQLGADFGAKIAFVSITVDPERDTPEVLKQYAQAFGANLAGWFFLTGASDGPAELLKNVCLRKDPHSPYADREGYVLFGMLVDYAGGRSNGCTSWSPSNAGQIIQMMKDKPTTLYIYPESGDIDAVTQAVKARRSLSRAGLYWNASCLKEIGSPKF
jgi:cytochrome oxidase Cu insertion factor (SCO1/SenC/PrrC family)